MARKKSPKTLNKANKTLRYPQTNKKDLNNTKSKESLGILSKKKRSL